MLLTKHFNYSVNKKYPHMLYFFNQASFKIFKKLFLIFFYLGIKLDNLKQTL